MGYKNGSLKGNGSFVVGTGGKVMYTGSTSGDNNQIVAFDAEGAQYKSVDLSELLDQQNYDFAESIVRSREPSRRKNGQSLEDGDLWFDNSRDYAGFVWDSGEWRAIPSVPFGTIIECANPETPAGFLICNGEEVPDGDEYDRLRDLMDEFNGGNLPTRSQDFPFHFIKY